VVFAIALTRVAVEGGMLSLLHDSLPLGTVAKLINSGPSLWLTPQSGIVPAAFLQAGFVVHMRGFVMPSFVQGFKLAHDRKIAPRPLMVLLAAVVVISLAMSLWMAVRLGYENGGLALGNKWWAKNTGAISFIDNNTRNATGQPLVSWISLLTGAGLTYAMMLARSRFIGFPLHPVGYLVSLSYSMSKFWFSIFLGWMCQMLLTRFGGHDSYRKAVPLFLGLALGDVAMILFWLVIDGWQGRTGHQLMPG
jgi:hypothetical protein